VTNYRGGDKQVQNLKRVRELRKNSTDAERALWRLLRSEGFEAWKFRRQHQFGPFILDFFCARAKLAIEVDGGQHYSDEALAADQRRSGVLNANGIRVMRFTNMQVLFETEAVAEEILHALLGS
jgi:very-short-patch-repair endonuclease